MPTILTATMSSLRCKCRALLALIAANLVLLLFATYGASTEPHDFIFRHTKRFSLDEAVATSGRATGSPNSGANLSLCSMVAGSISTPLHVEEWLHWHGLQGVSRFYVGICDTDDAKAEELAARFRRVAKNRWYDLTVLRVCKNAYGVQVPLGRFTKLDFQHNFLKACQAHWDTVLGGKDAGANEWFGMVDQDEFLLPLQSGKSITDVLGLQDSSISVLQVAHQLSFVNPSENGLFSLHGYGWQSDEYIRGLPEDSPQRKLIIDRFKSLGRVRECLLSGHLHNMDKGRFGQRTTTATTSAMVLRHFRRRYGAFLGDYHYDPQSLPDFWWTNDKSEYSKVLDLGREIAERSAGTPDINLIQFAMGESERALFFKCLENASTMFQFGIGGATVAALAMRDVHGRPLRHVMGVDYNVASVRDAQAIAREDVESGRLVLKHVDIPHEPWWSRIFSGSQRVGRERYRMYTDAMAAMANNGLELPLVVLASGRFRHACLLGAMRFAIEQGWHREEVTFLLHTNDEHLDCARRGRNCSTIESLFEKVERQGALASFRMPRAIAGEDLPDSNQLDKIEGALEEYDAAYRILPDGV